MTVEINQNRLKCLKRPGKMSVHRKEGKIFAIRKTVEFVFCFSYIIYKVNIRKAKYNLNSFSNCKLESR